MNLCLPDVCISKKYKINNNILWAKNSLTTPSIIDIWNPAFKGGEIYKIAIKSIRKGGEERKSHT